MNLSLRRTALLLPLSFSLLAFSNSSTAAEDLLTNSPWSINLMGGLSILTPEENASGRGLQVSNNNSIGFGLKINYDINDRFVANLNLASLGAAEISEPAPSTAVLGNLNYLALGLGVDWFPLGTHETFSPYLDIGYHTISNSVNNNQIRYESPGQNNLHFGAGVIWNYSANWGLSADVTSFDNTAQFLSVGLRYQFGCPVSLLNQRLETLAQSAVLDRDNDMVPDANDQCPDTPAGRSVDESGCELDDDHDYVVNDLDQCPETVAGVRVNAKGCGLDGDADGVFDGLDQCPNSAANVKVDLQGCEIKAEVLEAINITLSGVLFEFDSHQLKTEFKQLLDNKVTPPLLKYPNTVVEVSGHTDNKGDEEYNQTLSQKRAESVVSYLLSQGIKENRIRAKGYGESQPIADNESEEGRSKNRRVEINVVSP